MLSCKLTLADISGGGKDNVIPKTAEAVICIPKDEAALLRQEFEGYRDVVLEELKLLEPDTSLKLEKAELPDFAMDEAGSRRLVFALQFLPNGVERMNPEIEELVQCSLNLGIVNVHEEHITLRTLIRSNTASGKRLLLDKVTSFIEYLGGEVVTESDYPAWEYSRNSELRELMIGEYEKMYGKSPVVTAMHAGLECGIFAGKRPDLDMISIGPDLADVHTPQETMDVKSVERTWEYLKNVLAAMK
jgi:dipeptidase D